MFGKFPIARGNLTAPAQTIAPAQGVNIYAQFAGSIQNLGAMVKLPPLAAGGKDDCCFAHVLSLTGWGAMTPYYNGETLFPLFHHERRQDNRSATGRL